MKEAEQPELPAAPQRSFPKPELPKQEVGIATYQPLDSDGKWRVERWELLVAEFGGLTQELLPVFHLALDQRRFTIVRRLFGVSPVKVPLDGNPDDFRIWTRAELCEAMGISRRDLDAELDIARAAWVRKVEELPPPEPVSTEPTENEKRWGAGKSGIVTDEELLATYGFPSMLFDNSSGTPEDRKVERKWFVRRVREFEPALQNRLASRLAVQMLLTELRLRRAETLLSSMDESNDKLRKTEERVTELQKSYGGQLKQLQEAVPELVSTERQKVVQGTVSDFIQGIQEWYSQKENTLIDGIFTAHEIQVLLRSTTQMPMPQYRLGLVGWLNSVKPATWDTHFKARFRKADLAKLDAGFREGVRRLIDSEGIHVPNFLDRGPLGEFEDLYTPDEDEMEGERSLVSESESESEGEQ